MRSNINTPTTRSWPAILALALALCTVTPTTRADAEPVTPPEPARPRSLWERDRLTGDWNGLRPVLAEHGVDVGVSYTGDVIGIASGGLRRRTEYLGNLDLTLTVDAEKLVGWKGGSLFLYGLDDHGGDPSANAGDAQGIDNIAAPSTWKLYEAWLLQSFFDDRFSILAGLYDVNGEFDVNETASLFLNSAFGMGSEYGLSGRNGPSAFPVTSVAGRVKWRPAPRCYLQGVVADGVPGDPNDEHGTQIAWRNGDGVLTAFEAGYVRGKEEHPVDAYGKIALGGWYYTSRFDTVRTSDGEAKETHGSYGAYLLVEQTLYREAADPAQGLAGFVRLGFADDRVNPFAYFTAGGLVYKGLVPGRDEDQLGIAVAAAYAGHDLRVERERSGLGVSRAEVALEATQRFQLTPWLAVSADLQYIFDPDADPTIPDPLALGARFEVTF